MPCECLKQLSKDGYVQPNILDNKQYFLRPVTLNDKTQRRVAGTKLLLINYCPVCGKGIE